MRQAKVNDYFKRIATSRGRWTGNLKSIRIQNYEGITGLDINFEPSVNILVGANGSGKSRVLRAIEHALNSELIGSEDAVSITIDDRSNVEVSTGKPAHLVNIYRDYFAGYENLEEDLLNGISSIELGKKELDEINYVLCREYNSVEVFEVKPGIWARDADNPSRYSDEIVPFFKVRANFASWTSAEMGTGEFAAFYLWWLFHTRKDYEYVLLDEPETHLSYKVQERLANYLAKTCCDKHLFICLSSHSYPLIAKFPPKSIRPLIRVGSSIKLSKHSKSKVLEKIGKPIGIQHLFLVEDQLAKFVLECLLRDYLPTIADTSIISISVGKTVGTAAGASGVTRLQQAIEGFDVVPINVIGAYDGDMNPAGEAVAKFSKSNTIFLPGQRPLDLEFIGLCKSDIDFFERRHGGFEEAFYEFEGADYHDHLGNVAHRLQVPLNEIWRSCLERWVTENRGEVERTVREIEGFLKSEAE